MNRRIVREVDPSSWPTFDAAALTEPQRKAFLARRQAVELYVANTALSAIEASTSVTRCQLCRLLEHCLALHQDGRLFGWRALVPYARVADYRRIAKLQIKRDGSGTVGAFNVLLQGHPAIGDWITQQVHGKRRSTDGRLRMRLRGLKHDFLRLCRTLGLTAGDYPFNTERMGIRSLAAALRAECLRSFGRGARLAGATRWPHAAIKSLHRL